MQPRLVYADRYRLEDRLGSGAFGEVYAAFDEGLLQRRVALKLLRGAAEGVAPDEALAQRFITELRLAGALRHPHIAAVYDAGVWQGQLYMVQELVDGVDLGRFLADNAPLSVDLVLTLARQMLDALATAHEHSVIHRDIKPGNLLVDREHRLVVVDFGLATSSQPDPGAGGGGQGTPGYAAPEQVRGKGDARADQFSAAVVIYQMLTSVPPFVGKNLPETLRRTLQHTPDPPSRLRPELSPGLDRALLRALSKSPAERYPDLRAFSAELLQHAAYDALPSAAELRGTLATAAAQGRLVVVTGPDPGEWAARLRLPLVVSLGVTAGGAPAEVADPREEIYPSAEAPARLCLADDDALDHLAEATDGLRAALVHATLLVVDQPDPAALRRLLAAIRAWSPAHRVTAIAAAPRWSPDDLREAQRRGVLLLEQAPDALRAELQAELPPQRPREAAPLPRRPYKFLSYFDAADEAIFFGRDVELARMSARILARPVALLYGASGAGKTSLVRAALAPRLRRAGYTTLLTRVMDDPLGEICRAAGAPTEPPEGRVDGLARAARALPLLVIFLDQFEELFVRFPRPARERLAQELASALERSDGHLRLVFCLRADYLARLSELREHLPLSLEAGLYLESLSSAAAREAVLGPAALHGVGVEPALLDQILADLSDDGMDPPQLQLVCDALWEARAPGEPTLTLQHYRSLGEARTILTRHLAAALAGLPEAEQNPARDVLKAMVTTADTRSVRRLADLARATRLPVETTRHHLDSLARLRLVRPIEREDGVWVELTHEVLAAEISRWLSEDDRRLARVRELLEQGLRGYDQLGLLLSPAQLAVALPLVGRLELSPAEQALLARSRAAESRRRRRLLGVSAAALVLILAAVVGGRAIWLSQHAFARATEGRLSWLLWGEAIERPTSPITIYRGAAQPWALDAWLGYPKVAWQTDWVLTDLQPAARDALRDGVDLPDPARADVWLSERLSPVAAARERLLSGESFDAGSLLLELARRPDVGPADALALAPLVAMSPAAVDTSFADILQVAQLRAAALRVPGGGERLGGKVGGPLGLLLLRVPDTVWRPQLDALLGDYSGPELVGDVLMTSAPAEDMDGLAASLTSRRPGNVEAALRALATSGACAWQDEVRALVSAPSRSVLLERLIGQTLQLTDSCGSAADLPMLEGILAASLQGDLPLEYSLDTLRTLYRLDPDRGAALLARHEAQIQAERQYTTAPWGYQGDARMIALLTPGSPARIHGNLYLGDPSAVWPAWDFAFQDLSDPGRMAWLFPLALYQGEALQRRVLAKLAQPDTSFFAQVALIVVAAQRGDAEAARAVGVGLQSRDLLPLQTALNQLSAMPGPLPDDVGGDSRQAALGRAVAAIRRGDASPAWLRAALDDPSLTGLEAMLAVEGQRRIWSAGPPDAALDGLRSPWARVRLAATLALATRDTLPPMDPGDDPWLQRTFQRVRWAHDAVALDRELRRRARESLDQGQPRRARQIIGLVRGAYGPSDTLEATLSPQLPGVWPSELEDEAIYLHMLADDANGLGSATEWMLAYLPPSMWDRYATDPALAARRDRYLIRALTGQTPRLTVGEP